jgi:hypothetical protein
MTARRKPVCAREGTGDGLADAVWSGVAWVGSELWLAHTWLLRNFKPQQNPIYICSQPLESVRGIGTNADELVESRNCTRLLPSAVGGPHECPRIGIKSERWRTSSALLDQ